MLLMLQHAGIDHVVLRTPENTPNDPAALDELLAADPAITDVAAVHCETTTGILNPIGEIGRINRKHQRSFIVDGMSSFGAVPIDFAAASIDYLISSPNKCLEGVPGFCFVIARRAALLACEGHARSLSLDLLKIIVAAENAIGSIQFCFVVFVRSFRRPDDHDVIYQ